MFLQTSFNQQVSALQSLVRRINGARHERDSIDRRKSLPSRLADVFLRTWDLGFIAFGGPPSHIRILHSRFVAGEGGGQKWVDEQTYQELFALCQALPGPASTKLLFCIALYHAGFIPALLVFFMWSLPGAIGMFALALGVQHIKNTLPAPVYALLSGVNASTVGIVALAAVQLAEKAIKDKLSRLLVIFGACAGICYNALWYFPVLMAVGGAVTVVWDGWMSVRVSKVRNRFTRRKRTRSEVSRREDGFSMEEETNSTTGRGDGRADIYNHSAAPRAPVEAVILSDHLIRVKVGVAIVGLVFAILIAVLVARVRLPDPPLTLDLFANMYLAGTIIFGGGPVVIPLLRSYVVGPGWVSGRDFLLGLAIIQSFPGPNFNFAVYLGALSLQHSNPIFGAFLGFLGIFFPGLALAVAAQGFWRALRARKWVVDLLRGVNATAVGLVFAAVYRLWEIGYLTAGEAGGKSLAEEPWWVVVAAVTYAESAWFGLPQWLAIVFGSALGLCWYGAVNS